MNDFDYLEKYGDDGYQLDGIEFEEAQAQIDSEECRDATKKCIEKIRELIEEEEFNKRKVIDEIEDLLGYLEEF